MAGSTKLSDYRMSIFINNDQAKRSLMEMEKIMAGYEDELRKLERENKKDSQEYRDKKKVYDDHVAQMKEVRKQAGLNALSVKELRQLQAQLNNEMARAIPGSAHRKKLQTEFDAVNGRLKELTLKSKDAGFSFGRLADGFNRYFSMAAAGMAAIAGFAFSIKSLIAAQGELDDSLANIRKTTGMTAKEVRELNKQLGKIDTRTSRQELREMAVVAGQLGIQKDQIYDFVNAVDKLNVALGDEIKGGAEEVSKTMGTLRNVLTDMKSADIADDMLRIGNAINELGAAGFATAPVIADLSNRIGGIGIPLGLTSDEVLGLSATLQELNVSTERGGTAVVKILQKMTTNVGDFAKIAGLPVKEFTDLVNCDLFGAFVKVLEGSKRGGESATLLAGIIKELDISGAGASEVFAKVGNNIDMLNEKVGLAGKSLQGTDSIMNEFKIKNATLGATIAKLQKDFYSLITMPGVTEFFKNQVYHVVELIAWFKNLPNFIEKYKVAIVALTGATLTWIAAKTRSLQIGLLNTLMLKEGILLKAKDAIALEFLIVKEKLFTLWKGNGTVATKLATTAQYLWNAAIKANPIGALITAITAVVVAIKLYNRNSDETIAREKEKARLSVLLADTKKKLSGTYDAISNKMRDIAKLSLEQKKALQDEISMTLQNAKAKMTLLLAKQKNLEADAAQLTTWQKFKVNFLSTRVEDSPDPKVNQQKKQQEINWYIQQNIKEAGAPYSDAIKDIKTEIDKFQNAKNDLENILNAENIADALTSKTMDVLQEKLSSYQTALRNTVAGSEDYIRIQEKIKNVNKDLAKFNDTDNTTPANYEKNKKALKDHNNELLNIRRKIQDLSIELIKNGQEKELKLNELAYQREIETIKGNSSEEMQLRELYWLQKVEKEQQINKKYSDEEIARSVKIEEEKWKAIINADIKGSESWRANSLELLEKQKQLELQAIGLTDEEIQAIKEKYAAMRDAIQSDTSFVGPQMPDNFGKPAEGNLIQRSGADKIGLDFSERINALKSQRDIELEMAQGNADAQKGIWSEYYATKQGMIAEEIGKYAQYAQQVVSALSGVNQAMSDYENAQLKKDENANEKKKANLKKRLDSGQITQKQYNEQVARLDEQLDAKKKELSVKQAKRQKALSLAQAIINVAQAVTSALSAGPILGIILAALVGILGAVQIAYIASTPIPEAARGRYAAFIKARQATIGRYQKAREAAMGRFDFLGDDPDNRINLGDEPLALKRSRWRSSQAASGRYSVVGKDDGKLYRDVPFVQKPESGIYSSPTLFAETGREIILNPKHTENILRFRPDLVYQIMQVPQRASGNYPETRSTTPSSEPQQMMVAFDRETLAALQEFRESIKRPLRAEMSYDTVVDSISKVQTIEGEATR